MSWLTQAQIRLVLETCESYGKIYLTRIVNVCLVTGAQWSEAERITRSQLFAPQTDLYQNEGKEESNSSYTTVAL